MTFEQVIADHQPLDLVSGCLDDLALLDELEIDQAAIRARIHARLTRLGLLATATVIAEAPPCQD